MTKLSAHALRSALRSLTRQPGVLALATTPFALAFALATTVAGIIDALRHPRATNDNAGRVFRIARTGGFDSGRTNYIRTNELERVLDSVRGFAELTGHAIVSSLVEIDGKSVQRRVEVVRPNYGRVLGLRTAKGRMLSDADTSRDVAVVSDGVWRTDFHNRQHVDSATIAIRDKPYSVVGVLEEGMQATDVLVVTTQTSLVARPRGVYRMTVRLEPGWDAARVRPALDSLERNLMAARGIRLVPLRVELQSIAPAPRRLNGLHYVLLSAATACLLFACALVAGTLVAREIIYRKDDSFTQPGADGSHTTAAEIAVIAIAGAVASVLVVAFASSALDGSAATPFNWLNVPAPQWSVRVFAIACAVTVASIAITTVAYRWFAKRG